MRPVPEGRTEGSRMEARVHESPVFPLLLTRACGGGEPRMGTPGTQGNKAGPEPRGRWGLREEGEEPSPQADPPTEGIDSLRLSTPCPRSSGSQFYLNPEPFQSSGKRDGTAQ